MSGVKYLRGELSPAEKARFLRSCLENQEAFDELAGLIRLDQALQSPVQRERLVRALEERHPKPPPVGWRVAFPMAAVVVAAVLIVFFSVRQPSSPELVPTSVAPAARPATDPSVSAAPVFGLPTQEHLPVEVETASDPGGITVNITPGGSAELYVFGRGPDGGVLQLRPESVNHDSYVAAAQTVTVEISPGAFEEDRVIRILLLPLGASLRTFIDDMDRFDGRITVVDKVIR